jgi:hypothetical protein
MDSVSSGQISVACVCELGNENSIQLKADYLLMTDELSAS